MHEQVAKSLVYALVGGSTCMSVRLLGMQTCKIWMINLTVETLRNWVIHTD